MSRQIYFVQSRQDEIDLAHQLAEGYSAVAVPTRWRGRAVRPVAPHEVETSGMVLFPEGQWPAVEANISAVTDGSGDFHVFPWRGWCVRWNRTKVSGPDFGRAGRYYFDDDGQADEQAVLRSREIYEFIATYIRRTYPMIRNAKEASPTYVGPDAIRRIETGQATMEMTDGTPYTFRPNPKSRRR